MYKSNYALIIFIVYAFINSGYSQIFGDRLPGLKVNNYNLDVVIDYENEILKCVSYLTLENVTDKPIDEIPLLLYRMLKVKSISDENGKQVLFNQQILSYEDWETLQVNFIEVRPDKPIEKNVEQILRVEYEGHLLGYTETGMNYVKDKINKKFTILRPDCYAYPRIGYPSWASNRLAGLENFEYHIKITVPDTLVVANGGELIEQTNNDRLATYIYHNIKPAWRIDIAIAPYQIMEKNKFKVFYFPEDSAGAASVFVSLQKAFNLYTESWGELKDYYGYSVIEIPDGWGSQNDVTSIIQTASAFKDPEQINQLYHEVSHCWNVKINDKYSPRWNEGLATFIEYLTVEKLDNRRALDKAVNWCYNTLKKNLTKYPNIPFIKFGEENIQGLSYTMGMITFYILYNTINEDEFNNIFHSFYKKYYQTGATTEEFIAHVNSISKVDLTRFFEDWFLGTNYYNYISQNMSLDEIIALYKKNN